MRKCQLVDARLRHVGTALERQRDVARTAVRELELVPDVRRQLEALRAEAAALQPVLAALAQLYGALAVAGTGADGLAVAGTGTDDLAQQEAAHRQARHSAYQQIQRDMDAQYADACRISAQQRAASAARSFQRDLDDYRRGGMQARRVSPAGNVAAPAGSAHWRWWLAPLTPPPHCALCV
ncbi:hypothetical protein H4R19_002862 [Coemansia spiralis]|nr:hypothetical protein H4R19_002862 [Coemansia spiralis]